MGIDPTGNKPVSSPYGHQQTNEAPKVGQAPSGNAGLTPSHGEQGSWSYKDQLEREYTSFISTIANSAVSLQGLESKLDVAGMLDATAVMFEVAKQQKKQATEDRKQALDAQISYLESSAKNLREAADKQYSAAVATGVGAIVGGVISTIGAGVALGAGFKGDGGWANQANQTKATVINSLGGGLGGLSTASGKLHGDMYTRDSEYKRAASKEDDTYATKSEKQYSEDTDFRETAKQAQSAVIDFVRALVQSRIEMDKTVAKNL